MKASNYLNNVVNAGIVFAGAFFLLRPDGVVRTKVAEFRAASQAQRLVAEHWPALTEGNARIGRRDASRILVEFFDYECPFCAEQHERIVDLVAAHPDVAVVFKHFPLTSHANARPAAIASTCAESQGKFAVFHDRLFTTNEWRVHADWVREARAVRVPDLAEFQRCLEGELARDRVANDRALGDSIGVHGTPTFMSASGITLGVIPEEFLETR